MKEFSLIVREDEHGNVDVFGQNNGFNVFELIAILDLK